MVTNEAQWFVQKGSRVQGPYTCTEIGRYLVLGRVRHCDRVSRDGELWEPVTQVPELIPEELLDLDNPAGWDSFLGKRDALDERKQDIPVVTDRRTQKISIDSLKRDWRKRSLGESNQLPVALFGITLAVCGVLAWLNTAGSALGS